MRMNLSKKPDSKEKLHAGRNLQLFTADFAADHDRQLRWNAFLKKIQWKEPIDFPDVMKLISERLRPMYERYWRK